MKTFSTLALIAALSLVPATAARAADDPETQEQTAQEAKQARIDDYLKRKEAKKADRKSKKGGEPAAETAPAEPVEKKAKVKVKDEKDGSGWFSRRKSRRTEGATRTASSRRARRSGGGTPGGKATVGSRDVGQVLDRLRNSALMDDEAAREHMAIMDRGATPVEMASFGSYLAGQGYLPASVALYRSATRADPDNPALWLNLGTAQMRTSQVAEAGHSFQKAIRLDPNNAKAHYNLGAVYARSDYDKAIKEFATALTLDPGLGDPRINPQAANNDLLVPVKMMLYQSQEGSVALPLVPVEGERAAR